VTPGAPEASPYACGVSESVVDRVVARLTHQPDGKRSLFGALVRFGVTGVLSVAADVGTLALCRSGFSLPLWLCVVFAFAAGLIVNYTLNRNWTFQAQADHAQTMTRYAVLVGFNFGSTEAIVVGLHHAGLYYLYGKAIAVVINACINFTVGRQWVFRH
jgi:putative flippase GtrA